MNTKVVFLNMSKYLYPTLLFNPGVSGDLSQYCFPENIIITVNCQRLLKSTTITPVCRYDHQPGGQTTTPVDLYFGDIQIASTDRCSETCQVRKTCNRLCHKDAKLKRQRGMRTVQVLSPRVMDEHHTWPLTTDQLAVRYTDSQTPHTHTRTYTPTHTHTHTQTKRTTYNLVTSQGNKKERILGSTSFFFSWQSLG